MIKNLEIYEQPDRFVLSHNGLEGVASVGSGEDRLEDSRTYAALFVASWEYKAALLAISGLAARAEPRDIEEILTIARSALNKKPQIHK